jgi:hypothetical protein
MFATEAAATDQPNGNGPKRRAVRRLLVATIVGSGAILIAEAGPAQPPPGGECGIGAVCFHGCPGDPNGECEAHAPLDCEYNEGDYTCGIPNALSGCDPDEYDRELKCPYTLIE